MRNLYTRALLLLTFLLLSTSVLVDAQTPDFDWAKRMGGTQEVTSLAITSDTAGFVYATGYFEGTADFGPHKFTSAGGTDVFVVKMDSAGNIIWAQHLSDQKSKKGTSITVDDSGNVFVAAEENFAEVFKLNSAGNIVWNKKLSHNEVKDITKDKQGNIYCTGAPGYIIKLNNNGHLIWEKSIGMLPFSIAVDDSGYVYTTGEFRGTHDFDPGPGNYFLSAPNQHRCYISKLDSGGNFVWAKATGTGNFNRGIHPFSMVIDGAGNVYVTGHFHVDDEFGPFKLTAVGGYDIFLFKLDNPGNFLWAKRMGSRYGSESALGIALDDEGYLYTTGYFNWSADFGQLNLTSAGWVDAYILKSDPDGNSIWIHQITGSNLVNGNAITVAGCGKIYTAGTFAGTADFDPGNSSYSLTSAGGKDAFIHKLYVPNCRNISLPEDTVLCAGNSVELSPKGIQPGDKILWSTGDTTPSITVTTSGIYYITVTVDAFSFSDTIKVTFAPKPTVYIGPDTAFCGLVDYLLEPQTTNAQKFEWSTGDTSKTLYVDEDGTYSLRVSSEFSCQNADTVYIGKINYPYPPGLQDTTICGSNSHILDAKNPGSTYWWSTGKTSQIITVTESGLYIVTISNGFCSITDSVNVEFVQEDDCSKELNVFIPNAFTPNGYNPLFKAEGENIVGWNIKIFNRWGEEVFSTTDFSSGWDGTYMGRPSPEGIYVYIAEARGVKGEKKVHKGNLMLMR